MKCPKCLCSDIKVLDSRPVEESNSIRRRRECQQCGERFTTYEKVEMNPIIVIKKDQSRQAFDRDKILKGIMTACEKRPISIVDMERIADETESELSGGAEREISTVAIGEKVMEKLRTLDEVAYVRFASVYKRFEDINTFMEELQELLNGK